MKLGEEMFREALENATQTTKDSGHVISESMKSIMKKVDRLQTTPIDKPLKVKYKNWQEKIDIRTIIPEAVWYGHTEYHKEDQWLMDVWDVDKNAKRTYAMMDIIEFIKE